MFKKFLSLILAGTILSGSPVFAAEEKVEAGETINIPVAEVHINNNPRNCFARWFN